MATTDLTRAERAALALLDDGPVWARGHGRFRVTGGPVADRRVLQHLVDRGLARHVIPPVDARVLPHFVKR